MATTTAAPSAAPTATPTAAPTVVLASSSPYRRALLARLLPGFEVISPGVDESPIPGEDPLALATRLARAKGVTVARERPAAIVIASDQVAVCGGHLLGKPGVPERAVEQLTVCSGRTLRLLTAVSVLGPGDGGAGLTHVDETLLHFRTLSPELIGRYVERDSPLDCAGAFRFEGLGAALFSTVETTDPTAIQGLPLLWVAQALERLGVRVI